MKNIRLPGFVSYVAVALWFLLSILAPLKAGAMESDRPVALTASDILPSIESALMARGAGARIEIALAEPGAVFYAAPGAEPVFDSVSFNEASGRFLIRVRSADGAPVAIAGFARTPARLPVLAANVERGEKIDETMIDWIETADVRARDYVLEADGLVGMTARRPLAAGAPVRPMDVEAPLLVKKGALVTMTYADFGVTLTEHGVAQNSGAKGDVIGVKNVKSDRIMKAVVRGDGLVAVAGSRRPVHASLER